MSLVQSVKWITVSQVFKIVAQLISIFYLTTLIPPQEYGVLAMAAVVMNFASIFNELGTGAAIIQKQGISVGFYNFIYKINMATGFFCNVQCFVALTINCILLSRTQII